MTSIFRNTFLTFLPVKSKDKRSRVAVMNVLISFACKILAVLISFILIPLTINYLNAEQYGIWLTISSIVSWVSFFDIGLGHGFKNQFAEARANHDNKLAQKYLSTTYIVLICIFGFVLLLFESLNPFIDWCDFLKVSSDYAALLRNVFSVVLIAICAQFVVNIFSIMLSADQKTSASSIIYTIGQIFVLLSIGILTKCPNHSMIYLSIGLTFIPVFVTLICSIIGYLTKYKDVRPSIKCFDKSLINNVLSLGVKFFIIQISMVFIFQMTNVILSRILGPESVTEYNIVYKYFSVSVMLGNIISTPLWPAFTDAFVAKDFLWMKNVHKKTNRISFFLILGNIALLVIYPFVFKIWLKGSVNIHVSTVLSMCLYSGILTFSNMNMMLINGTGKVFLQSTIYIICAFVAVPINVFACKHMGIAGILLSLSVVYVAQAFFANKQLRLLYNGKAEGIWYK